MFLICFTIRFWHLYTGELIYTLSGHAKEVTAVAVTSDGNKTISGSHDCMVKVWNTDINSRYSNSTRLWYCGDIAFSNSDE